MRNGFDRPWIWISNSHYLWFWCFSLIKSHFSSFLPVLNSMYQLRNRRDDFIYSIYLRFDVDCIKLIVFVWKIFIIWYRLVPHISVDKLLINVNQGIKYIWLLLQSRSRFNVNRATKWKNRLIDTQLYFTIYPVVVFKWTANVMWCLQYFFLFSRMECTHKSSLFYCSRCEWVIVRYDKVILRFVNTSHIHMVPTL